MQSNYMKKTETTNLIFDIIQGKYDGKKVLDDRDQKSYMFIYRFNKEWNLLIPQRVGKRKHKIAYSVNWESMTKYLLNQIILPAYLLPRIERAREGGDHSMAQDEEESLSNEIAYLAKDKAVQKTIKNYFEHQIKERRTIVSPHDMLEELAIALGYFALKEDYNPSENVKYLMDICYADFLQQKLLTERNYDIRKCIVRSETSSNSF